VLTLNVDVAGSERQQKRSAFVLRADAINTATEWIKCCTGHGGAAIMALELTAVDLRMHLVAIQFTSPTLCYSQ